MMNIIGPILLLITINFQSVDIHAKEEIHYGTFLIESNQIENILDKSTGTVSALPILLENNCNSIRRSYENNIYSFRSEDVVINFFNENEIEKFNKVKACLKVDGKRKKVFYYSFKAKIICLKNNLDIYVTRPSFCGKNNGITILKSSQNYFIKEIEII